jgi:hypothetical protein
MWSWTMKTLPDKKQLDIMWTVATSTSIETGIRPHYGFAKMLYDELNDIQPPISICYEKGSSQTQKQQGKKSSC